VVILEVLLGISAVDYAQMLMPMPLSLSLAWPDQFVSEVDRIVMVADLQAPPADAVPRLMLRYC